MPYFTLSKPRPKYPQCMIYVVCTQVHGLRTGQAVGHAREGGDRNKKTHRHSRIEWANGKPESCVAYPFGMLQSPRRCRLFVANL